MQSIPKLLAIFFILVLTGGNVWSIGETYTFDSDFDQGTLVGINHKTPNTDQLQLDVTGSSFPVLWIANSGENTLSKIDSTQRTNSPGREIARYFTWTDNGSNGSPSRTAVDKFGNAYVLNRGFYPLVLKILNNTSIDRNNNGVLDTSTDANNDGRIQPSELRALIDVNKNGIIDQEDIQDERIAWAKRIPDGTYNNGSTRNNGGARALCLGTDGNLWVGLYNNYEYYKISAEDGHTIAGPVSSSYPNYGCLIDQNGTLWGASWSNNVLIRIGNTNSNTGPYTATTISVPSPVYGLALRRDDVSNAIHVIMGGSCNSYVDYNDSTKTWSRPAAVNYCTYAVGTDNIGNILVSKRSGGVTKFNSVGGVIWDKGSQVGSSDSRGVIADSNNDIWQVHLSTNNVAKYKGTDGSFLGVVPVGRTPYTYSDASGTAALSITTKTGSWSIVKDSTTSGKKQVMISWNATIPSDASLTVESRTANTQAFQSVANGRPFNLTGRYIEVKVTLNANPRNESPILHDLTVAADPETQTISSLDFTPPNLTVGATTTVSATASSNLPVEFSSTSPDICTVDGNIVTGVNSGICSVAANQIGDADYKPAPQMTQNLTVSKSNQTISKPTFTSETVLANGTTTVNAIASTALPVTFSSNTPATCTVNDTIVTGVTAGTCTVVASQNGNANYNSASNSSNIRVDIGIDMPQTINVQFIPATLTVGATTTITALATSGLEVTLQSTTPAFCKLSGTILAGIKVGTCIISANQTGNANYLAANQVTKSIEVGKGYQIINFDELPSKTFGDQPFIIKASSSSGLPVSFMSITTEVCTATPTTKMTGVTLIGTGTCTLQASQAGNASYEPAPTVTQSFNVIPRIAVAALDNIKQTYDGKKKNATCSARVYGPKQIMLATTITYSDVGSGTGRIQVGNYGVQCAVTEKGYSGSTSGTLEIVQAIDKVIQKITFDTLPNKTVGDPSFIVKATASSGLQINFSTIGSATVCAITDNTVTLLGAGTCIIKASQIGNANYQAAPDQYLTFTVLPK